MIQSLVRKEQVDDTVAGYGHVIVDECHHVSASSFARVLSEVKARFVLGLTATPRRRDGHDPIVEMQLGPIRFAVSAKASAAARGLAHGLVLRDTSFSAAWTTGDPIQNLYAAMAIVRRTSRPFSRKPAMRTTSPIRRTRNGGRAISSPTSSNSSARAFPT
jgi:Type III restriction enzyme, res subunit